MFQNYIDKYKSRNDMQLLQLTIYSKNSGESIAIQNRYGINEEERSIIEGRRTLELLNIVYPSKMSEIQNGELFLTAIISRKNIIKSCAWLYFLMIITSILILFSIAFFIDRDSNKLIVEPFNDMMNKIEQIKINPVEASKIAEK